MMMPLSPPVRWSTCITTITVYAVVVAAAILLLLSSSSLVEAQSKPSIATRWGTACDFVNTTESSTRPAFHLMVDNYAARSENRAMVDGTPATWQVQLPINLATSPAATSDGVRCVGRFQWRGFIPPFWLSSLSFGDGGRTLPKLSTLDQDDLLRFASCGDFIHRLVTDPIRVSVRNVMVTGDGTWSTTSSATVPQDSRCDLAATSDLSQFVRVFAITPSGVAEQILPAGATSSGGGGGGGSTTPTDRALEWVATDTRAQCPIYFGVALDPAVCPGTITMSGTSVVVSMEITMTVGVEAVMVWYMWTPTLVFAGLGIICLVVYAVRADNKPTRETPAPDAVEPSIALALAKVCFVSASVVSATAFALALVIDQNHEMQRATTSAVILMASLFVLSVILVIAVGGMLAGTEDKQLKSMPVFIVAWLRLTSRSLAVGTMCAAWYRGFIIIGVLSVVFQFLIEIGFWANMATTFSASHEPLRFGVAGDQMLVCSGASIAGLYFPVVGVIASAASRVFCVLEMSERFKVLKKPDEEAGAAEAEAASMTGDAPSDAAQGTRGGGAGRGATNNNNNTPQTATKAQQQLRQLQQQQQKQKQQGGAAAVEQQHAAQAAEDEQQNAAAAPPLPYAVFPVTSTAALAGAFEGILSVRWWSIVFETFGLAALTLAMANAHPPFVTYAIMHLLTALGHFGAGFGAIAGGEGFGNLESITHIFRGELRPTCEITAGVSLVDPLTGEEDGAEDAEMQMYLQQQQELANTQQQQTNRGYLFSSIGGGGGGGGAPSSSSALTPPYRGSAAAASSSTGGGGGGGSAFGSSALRPSQSTAGFLEATSGGGGPTKSGVFSRSSNTNPTASSFPASQTRSTAGVPSASASASAPSSTTKVNSPLQPLFGPSGLYDEGPPAASSAAAPAAVAPISYAGLSDVTERIRALEQMSSTT